MAPDGQRLRLSRLVAAPPEDVFRLWTDPREMRRWFSPVGFTTPHAEAEARPGGSWRLGMQPPGGDIVYVSGTYREVRPPERLVFTWRWEPPSPYPEETLVTVEFRAHGEAGAATEVVLTHERLVDPDAIAHHRSGWEGCLESLAATIAAAAP